MTPLNPAEPPAPAMGTNACPEGSTNNRPQADKSLLATPLSRRVTPLMVVPAPLTVMTDGYGDPEAGVPARLMAPGLQYWVPFCTVWFSTCWVRLMLLPA